MRAKSGVLCQYLLCSLVFLPALAGADEVQIGSEEMLLNGRLAVADGRDMADGILLLLHGTLAHNEMEIIKALQSTLLESGYNSLAVNLSLNISDRHGFYPCDSPHTHIAQDASHELGRWVDWLKLQGVNNIVLLGHSRGANQAVKYVLAHNESVSSLILLAPPATDVTLSDEIERQLDGMEPDGWLSGIDFLHCANSDVQVASYLSYLGPDSHNDTVALLRHVSVPTLVISGSEDTVAEELPVRMADVSNDFVTHTNIDGADHFFRDLYMYDVVDAAVAFLEMQSP